MRIYRYSPVPEPGSGMQAGLPEEVRFRVRFARARRILSLDCDFFIKTPMETRATSLRPAPRKGFITKKKTGTEHAFTPWRDAFP